MKKKNTNNKKYTLHYACRKLLSLDKISMKDLSKSEQRSLWRLYSLFRNRRTTRQNVHRNKELSLVIAQFVNN